VAVLRRLAVPRLELLLLRLAVRRRVLLLLAKVQPELMRRLRRLRRAVLRLLLALRCKAADVHAGRRCRSSRRRRRLLRLVELRFEGQSAWCS
jgi:hypothetical protein